MRDKVFIRSMPDSLWRALKARASLEGITVSKAVQRAIRGYLAGPSPSGPDPWRGLIGLGDSGVEDVADLHDEYLSGAIDPRKGK